MTQVEQSKTSKSELKEIVGLAEAAEAKMQLFADQAEEFISKWEQTVSEHDNWTVSKKYDYSA